MTHSPSWRSALASLALGALALSGCDSSGPDDRPPAPISAAAFQAGVDAFPDDAARTAGAGAGENYAQAAVRVGVVTALVGLNLAVPHLATEAVTQDTPEVVDGVWVWETTEDVLGTPVALRLEADPDGSEIDWRLTSQRLGADPGGPFTYYTATTSTDGRTGAWRLFLPDQDGVVLTAEFDVRDDREVTFAVPAGRDGGGSSVRYRTEGSTQTFDLVREPGGARSTVRWDLGTGAGSITADAYRGGARACWDRQLRDVACG